MERAPWKTPRLRGGGTLARVVAPMISTIAVATDGSETAAKAVDMAAEMARRFGAKVVLVSVYDDSAGGSSGKVEEDLMSPL